MAILLAAGAIAFVCWRAWVCDDAFITFRHAANCLAGHGPVFNPGERVQGFTHPLWFLVLLAGGLVLDLYPLAVILGLISTAAVMLVVAWFFRKRRHAALCLLAVAGILLSSRTFIEYQTSGLETCLTHLLVAWVWAWLLARASNDHDSRAPVVSDSHSRSPLGEGGPEEAPEYDRTGISPSPAGIVLLCSLLMLTRPDFFVPCVPLLILAVRLLWRHGDRPERLLSLLAVLPLLAWYGFATVYYGTPLPNTAYAKTGIPLGTAILHGLAYQRDYGAHEPIHGLLIPIVLIVQTIIAVRDVRARRPGGEVRLALVLAVWLHAAYVVLIGGDFMRGRFLTLRLVASATFAGDLVARLSPARSWTSALSLVMVAGLAWSFGRAESHLIGVQAIGPPGVHPMFPLAFLALAGLGGLVVTALAVKRRFLPAGRVAACLLLAGAGLCVLFDFRPRTSATAPDGIADEHAWYRGAWRESRFAPPARYPVAAVNDWVELGKSARRYADQHGPIAIAFGTIGLLGYYAGPDVHIVDRHGLTDPFIARLPAEPTSRVGHLRHAIPEEYLRYRGVVDKLADWRPRLDEGDPTLAVDARASSLTGPWREAHLEELWKEIETVTRGALLSADRWKLIPRYAAGRR